MLTRWRTRDVVLAVLSVLLAVVLLGHRLIPDVGGFGTALDSFLPWLGLVVVPLLLLAAVLRTKLGALAVLVPVLAWAVLFVPTLVSGGDGGRAGLRVVTQNLGGSMSATSALAKSGADLIAVQERTGGTPALDREHPYTAIVGTVGLWSRYPVADVRRLDLAQGWPRALRATVSTPDGPVSVYVVHLASIRIGESDGRDRALSELAALVDADPASRALVLGDFNTASTDRRFDSLTTTLTEARTGFGFTWPAGFPLTRPDHVLSRGFTSAGDSVLPSTGSDHRAVQVDLASG
ncbi:endonuclease/exonuclease/phosphatase family protein [Amycolatopsis sp. H20-H5]|uniref:endonuclease/exonuclease/phosphatase family protein n=1 Tax=Amycolatopsis sp. H20-H5 TaxID=3046309 RepID=UPI002DBBB403|nr:endonuclease/exonuclease/phosphatase family protein [Amycolatopsis sp. H20-H5]MEC3976442.1 endonuclease/exonuclease/phosphatase family protein [Amycolatopsis sp. H20-H5]